MPSAINAKIVERYPTAELLVTKALNESEAGMWDWMRQWENVVLIQKRILFWTIKITVGDLVGFLQSLLDDEEPKPIAG